MVRQSQYGKTIFIIPKKKFTVRFIMDYRSLNHKLVIKQYSLPRMVNTIQTLGGFHYAAALDLNMVYYSIRILHAIQDITTIVN